MLLLNPAYERVTGLRAADILGSNVGDLVKKGIIDRSATMEAVMVAANTRAISTVRLERRTVSRTMATEGSRSIAPSLPACSLGTESASQKVSAGPL